MGNKTGLFIFLLIPVFAKSISIQNITYCNDPNLVEIKNLTFPGGEIEPLVNLTWGKEEFGQQLNCISKFVLLYEWDEGSGVLCPSFNISKIDKDKFGCLANFSKSACNRTVHLSLEAWTFNSSLLTTHGKVYINCQNVFEKVAEPVQASLTEAVFSILESVAPILNGPWAPNCTWTEWSDWSSCSKSCGEESGKQSRERTKCEETETESKECQVNKCPIDCSFGPWTEWSQCSQSCGTGQRKRTRQVSEEAKYGGKSCQEKDKLESETCLAHTCPVHGQWGEWSRWSYCNSTCGQGFKSRTRLCDNPKPENGGFECFGNDREEMECAALRACQPIDGSWSAWTRWSGCSEPCGKGNIIRSRTCSNPQPQHGGQGCLGDSFQKRPCYLKKCVLDQPAPKEDQGCPSLPYIYGFLGPEKMENGKAKYVCYHGKVIDIFTNRRDFFLPCEPDEDFEFPEKWPECEEPKYCIGPAKKDIKGMESPFPIRDVPVNSGLEYKCENGNKAFASCSLDGIYRYPKSFLSCGNSSSDVFNLCETENINVTKSEAYGWIQGSGNCSVNFSVSNGLFVKVGIEKMPETNVRLDGQVKEDVMEFHKDARIDVEGDVKMHYVVFEA